MVNTAALFMGCCCAWVDILGVQREMVLELCMTLGEQYEGGSSVSREALGAILPLDICQCVA